MFHRLYAFALAAGQASIAALHQGRRLGLWLCVWSLGWVLAACHAQQGERDYTPQYSPQPPQATPAYKVRVGIHPLHNPALLFQRYGPLVAMLNQHIPQAHFTLEASRNYQEFENKLAQRQLDIALPNPYQTLQAQRQGYRVFGKMGDDNIFRGVVLVRKDSGIHHATDLRGKSISFPAPTALAATLQPQYALHQQGLPVGSYEARYVGSQESSIMNVLLGSTAAAATWPVPWQAFILHQPEQAAQLHVLLETPHLVNNAWVARDDLPPALVQDIAQVLFMLHTTEAGRKILADLPASYFEPASAATYTPVQVFLDDFTHTIGPIAPTQ